MLDNSFCTLGDSVFKQRKGVLQCSNISPLLADLTMSWLEYKFSSKHMVNRNNVVHPIRYMDDILVIHNKNSQYINDMLEKVYNNLFEIVKTNTDDYSCNYLDLEINIVDNKLCTRLYNKTDDFNFVVKRLPNAISFISNNIKKDTIYTETLRIARTCTYISDFTSRIRQFKDILIHNGYDVNTIVSCVSNTFVTTSLYYSNMN